ncbi:uncharacterized protein LOC127242999 isoform X2 [Andrographis paniculata]|uniref:uncharacterized protein LOC127242999 isoform X2 n=1 Tax=Andrographis paniculata TaxID=175694 RepID=UPI0021E977D8|nr:uncharacterized protein LOC127242999 isoform X2 [Andrographis paniculata]
MQLRFRRLRIAIWALPRVYYGTLHGGYGAGVNALTDIRCTAAWFSPSNGVGRRQELANYQLQRYSTVPETKREVLSVIDILPFIRSSLHKPRGPFHCWLNTITGNKNLFKEDGIFLFLIDEHLEHSLKATQNSVKMFEYAKSLQQRYPSLQVMALQYGKSIRLNDIPTNLLQRVIKEYFVFPILLSRKVADVPCFIISKGFQNPIVCSGVDVDLKVLDNAIYHLNAETRKQSNVDDFNYSPWAKPIDAVKEPDICSASRNLLFPFPGCISVDESGNRLFLSDVNHHRVIMFNNNGKMLDAIGSSPGYEDGEFEIAKLMRPAASFYDASDDCLYFVDSENHAIRRADMETRVVDTVFPRVDGSTKYKSLWAWIVDKLWRKRRPKMKSEEFNSASFLFPWHLLKSSNDDLLVLNQSLGTLWIVDLESGQIKEVVKESSKILEICGQMILEKLAPLSHLPSDWLDRHSSHCYSFEGLPYAGLMSSVATCQDHDLFCNTVGQTVVKFDRRTASASTLKFSNFGILGLPYWLGSSSPEHLYAANNPSGTDIDHSEGFRLLPGRVDIELNVEIPRDTDLVEPPQEGSIWRFARGSAMEVSGLDNNASPVEKIGLAQQWYDELDNLTFAIPDEESRTEDKNEIPIEETPDGRVRIGCTIDTSPGTSEAVIYAALYLRLKKNSNKIDTQCEKASRIADVIDPKRKFDRDVLIKTLMMPGRDLGELVFVRPIHVRLQFNVRDRPKADKSRRELLTDSSVKVDVSL